MQRAMKSSCVSSPVGVGSSYFFLLSSMMLWSPVTLCFVCSMVFICFARYFCTASSQSSAPSGVLRAN
jgi:hypothetical protein